MNTASAWWAPQAWVGGRWRRDVLLRADAQAHWSEVTPDTPAPADAQCLCGPVLPGLVNAHSHAFQRAFAGLAEWRSDAHDDFWSWRERMYRVALRVSPEQLHAIAAQLYAELLQGGYTQVCEFHYLHRAEDGSRHADPLQMGRALLQAARDTGIGLTLLPVLYERSGFTQPALRDEQRRFAGTVDEIVALRDGLRALGVATGLAAHSLRAVSPASLAALAQAAGPQEPLHIHVAEQTREVDDCIAATGLRPVQWLLQHAPLDARWQLVHATHTTPDEIDGLARCGAGVVLCPSTEANLGDGVPDLPRLLAQEVPWSLGTDSQVSRCWVRELRLLEEVQRLAARRRNVAAAPERGVAATAARLFECALQGGAAALRLPPAGLVRGARADFIVLSTQADALLGVPDEHVLDALVFAADAPCVDAVWVAGRQTVAGGLHVHAAAIAAAFEQTMARLWTVQAG